MPTGQFARKRSSNDKCSLGSIVAGDVQKTIERTRRVAASAGRAAGITGIRTIPGSRGLRTGREKVGDAVVAALLTLDRSFGVAEDVGSGVEIPARVQAAREGVGVERVLVRE
jgi:hypothetical protein